MDKNENHPLVTLMLEMERLHNLQFPDAQEDEKRLSLSPHARMQLETQKKLWAAAMLEQSYDCPYATLLVKRDRNAVTARWQYKECVKSPNEWSTFGALRKIEYIPDANSPAPHAFIQKKGNGEMRWTIPDGQCYSGLIIFMDLAAYASGADARITSIYFNFAVPMPYGKTFALTNVAEDAQNREVGVHLKLFEFMEKRDQYDTAMRESIGLIKAKGLSPEDEQREIADLKDYGQWLKEKHGI